MKKLMFAIALLFPVNAWASDRCKIVEPSVVCDTAEQVSFNGAVSTGISNFASLDGSKGTMIWFDGKGMNDSLVLAYLIRRYGRPTIIKNDGIRSTKFWLNQDHPKSVIMTRTDTGSILVVIEP